MADTTINLQLILNSAGAAKTMAELKESIKQVREASLKVADGTEAFKKLKETSADLAIKMASSAKSVTDVRNALKELKTAALETEEGTEAFQNITRAAGELKDKMDDVNANVKFFSDDMRNLTGTVSVIKGIAGSFATLQGGMALFGAESKSVEKSLLKVQGAMSLLTGISEIANTINKNSTAMIFIQNAQRSILIKLIGAQTIETAAEAVATGTATIAQRALNAAVNANPIFLLVTILVAATAGLMLFSSASDEAKESQEALNTANEEQIKKMQTFNNLMYASYKQRSDSRKKGVEIDILSTEQEIALLEGKTKRTEAENQKLIDLQTSLSNSKKALIDIDIQLEKEASTNRKNEIDTRLGQIDKEKQAATDLYNSYTIKNKEDWQVFTKEINKLNNESLQLAAERTELETKLTEDGFLEKKKIENDFTLWEIENGKKVKEEKDRIEKERRKLLLEGLNDDITRTKNAIAARISLEAGMVENIQARELELQEISFGSKKAELIDKATQREIKLNEDKYLNLKITQEEFEANKLAISSKGIENLNAEEKKLYDAYIANNTNITNAIKQRFAEQRTITVAETTLILETTKELELKYAKEIEIINAEKITNEEEKNAEILRINVKYNDQLIAASNKVVDAQIALLTDQYNIDLVQKGLTDEEKLKLEAKYQQDVLKLRGDAAIKTGEIEAKGVTDTANALADKKRIMEDFAAAMGNELINMFSNITARNTEVRLNSIEMQKEAALKQFEAEKKGYLNSAEYKNMSDADRADAQEVYTSKQAELEKQFEIEKADAEYKNQIAQWEYTQAQAAINMANAILKSMPNPYLVAATGILGLTQIATIQANKPVRKMAIGGYVNGEGTGTSDSIPTMLSNGEYVVNARATRANLALLNAINSPSANMPHMANGGMVSSNVNVDNSQLASVLKEIMSEPLKAYVVSTEISKQQKADTTLINKARF